METLDAVGTVLLPKMIDAGAAEDAQFAGDHIHRAKIREAWQRHIDKYLIEWGRNPDLIADEDLVPPSRDVVQRACNLALDLRDRDCQAPLRVVPDGDGGVSFEWYFGEDFMAVTVSDDLTVGLEVFKECKMVHRSKLVVPDEY